MRGLNVKQEQYDTPKGSVIELYGDDDAPIADLSREFSEFTAFMDACSFDPDAALQLISSEIDVSGKAEQIVTRFAKEAKRLQIDLECDDVSLTRIRSF